ncbi:MAG: DUF5305 domain-containing protein [Heliobacteriaceae bacterium]|nr:DUF5305 domain-containing protein [Heliobacteriaceae bacterium]
MAASAGKDNTQVWERRFVLQPAKSFEAKGGSVSLQENIPLRVADYNAFVRQVAEEADLNANETKLVVYWNVWVEAITDSGPVKEQIASTMVIPLGEKYFQVSGELNQDKPGTLTGVRQVPAGVNKSVVIGCGLVALGCLAVLGLLFFCSSEPKEERDTVRKTVDRITKKYGDRLAVIEGDWPIAWENGIVMKSIEDLVRIADEVSKPIICRLSATDKPLVYCVVDEANVYLYRIRNNQRPGG